MIKMEAELTALKEELSTRSKPGSSNSSSTSETQEIPNHSAGSNGTESCSTGKTNSVIRKTENTIKDESSEEKN